MANGDVDGGSTVGFIRETGRLSERSADAEWARLAPPQPARKGIGRELKHHRLANTR
jgi:hypothetical protein